MKLLLDVNALIAFGILHHEFHGRVAAWVQLQGDSTFMTCSLTELGFVRVAAQAPEYGFTVAQARTFLLRLKKDKVLRFEFIPDRNDISFLPAWAKSPKQTTDGHLLRLAIANGAVLATLDTRIPGAHLIP